MLFNIRNDRPLAGETFMDRREALLEELNRRNEAVPPLPVVAAAALRMSEEDMKPKPKNDEGGVSIFWRLFGGAILSGVVFLGVTLYNSLNSSISDIRNQATKLSEDRANLVRKEDFETKLAENYKRYQDVNGVGNELKNTLTAQKSELESLKDKFTKLTLDYEAAKKELALMGTQRAELDSLKDKYLKLAADVEVNKKDVSKIEVLTERTATLVADVKVNKDDLTKLRQELDKNVAYDAERKMRRDEMQKELEKSIKDLAIVVQDLQVKVGKLEVMVSTKPELPKEPAELKKPAKSGEGD
jgi:DNA repair exonuclease SbcCD ATPase subunit